MTEQKVRLHKIAVWMRDLLGVSDDLEGSGIGRLEAGVGEVGRGSQAQVHDLLAGCTKPRAAVDSHIRVPFTPLTTGGLQVA
jgi:hypothetical protein